MCGVSATCHRRECSPSRVRRNEINEDLRPYILVTGSEIRHTPVDCVPKKNVCKTSSLVMQLGYVGPADHRSSLDLPRANSLVSEQQAHGSAPNGMDVQSMDSQASAHG